MYIAIVLCLMLIFPLAGIGVEHGQFPLMLLVGKWFVFFGVGWRLAIAGLRQIIQPRFTLQQIHGGSGEGPLLVVRELGFANLSAGLVGITSLWMPTFVLPAAIGSGIFYAAAGGLHVVEKERGLNENVAMISDLGIALVLAAFVIWSLA
jgi:hypothetical protein